MSREDSARHGDLAQLSAAVSHADEQLRHQMRRTKKADDNLAMSENKVRHFQLDRETYNENEKNSRYKRQLEKPSTAAAVTGEYNFETPLHRHRYLLDASLRPAARKDSQSSASVSPQHHPTTVERKQHHLPSLTQAHCENDADKLPANIQHYYGTEVCRTLFGNDITPAVQRSKSPPTCQCRDGDATTSAGGRLVLDPNAPGFQYESLGRILRSNVIHGTNVVYQRSVTHDDFRSSVFDGSQSWLYGRTGKAAPDNYRYRKDELSRWAEHNIIRTRMMKSMDVGKEKPKKA